MKKIKIILLTLISVFNIHSAKNFIIFENITYERVLRVYSHTNLKSIKIIKGIALNYLKYLDDNNIKTLLHHSVLSEKADDFKILLFLLNANDFLEIRRYIYEKNQYLPFYNENKLTTYKIIAKGLIDQESEKDKDGNNFLHIAAKHNKDQIIKFVLSMFVKESEENSIISKAIHKIITEKNNLGQTILHTAIENGCRESVIEILKYSRFYFGQTEDFMYFIFKKDNNQQTVFDLLLKNFKKNDPLLHINSITTILLAKLILFYSNDYFIKRLAIKLLTTHPKKKDDLIELFKTTSKKIFTPKKTKASIIMEKIQELIKKISNVNVGEILFNNETKRLNSIYIDEIEQSPEKTKLKIKIPLSPYELLLETPYYPPQTPHEN